MGKLICDTCQGPLVEQNGNIICAVCGANYTSVTKSEYAEADFSEFYNKVSIEKFCKITSRLAETVFSEIDHPERFIALKSNGMIYSTRNHKPTCFGVVKLEYRWNGEIGITGDGELQADTIELAELFQRIRESGISSLKLKQICKYQYYKTWRDYSGQLITCYDTFLGVDIEGKVVLYNPFDIFHLCKNKPEDVKKCGERVQWYKSLPPVKSLWEWEGQWAALTEEGKVLFPPNYINDKTRAMHQWNELESLYRWHYNEFKESSYSVCYLGLKKDGTLVVVGNDPDTKEELSQNWNLKRTSDIVQIKWCGSATAFLYRNGDLEVPKLRERSLVAKNVVAIVQHGYICADGSLYICTDSENYSFSRIPDVKLFDNIETLHEEWETSQTAYIEKKQATKEALQKCAKTLEDLQSQRVVLQEKKENLGLFQFKDRSEINRKLEDIDNRIECTKREIASHERHIHIMDGTPVRSAETFDTTNIYSSTAAVFALRDDLMNHVATSQKSTSVIGSAAVGGLIAGPAGAVVGAIYAADKNQKNKN